VYSRITENVQIFVNGVCLKISAKFLCAIYLLLLKAFKRAVNVVIQWLKEGLKIDLVWYIKNKAFKQYS